MAEKLQDFGEHIAGAKKETHTFTNRDFTSAETRGLPLSKLWDKKEIDAIEDKTIAAIAYVLRENIPNKPRQTYRLNYWFSELEKVQSIIKEYVEANDNAMAQKFIDKALEVNLKGGVKMAVLSQIDRKDWDKVKEAEIGTTFLSGQDYSSSGTPVMIATINNTKHRFYGEVGTKSTNAVFEQVFPQFQKQLEVSLKNDVGSTKGAKPVQFTIWQNRNRPLHERFFITCNSDKTKTPLISFGSVEDARTYKKENIAELTALWEDYKAMHNVKKENMRRSENEVRTGVDYRNGRDITPEEFMEAFGIRGGQFGNWVTGDERTAMLNNAYDGFMDLARATNIPPNAIGLNGKLAIAFGARGSGMANAHYEPSQVVINLTRTRGAGSLAHEWWHGFDNYMNEFGGYATQSPKTANTNLDDAVKALRKAILDPKTDGFLRRSENADKFRNKAYFGTTIEMTARAFESHVIAELDKLNSRNDFLANVYGESQWLLAPDAYPYPTKSETQELSAHYNNVFDVIVEVDKNFKRDATMPVRQPTERPSELQLEQAQLTELAAQLKADNPQYDSMIVDVINTNPLRSRLEARLPYKDSEGVNTEVVLVGDYNTVGERISNFEVNAMKGAAVNFDNSYTTLESAFEAYTQRIEQWRDANVTLDNEPTNPTAEAPVVDLFNDKSQFEREVDQANRLIEALGEQNPDTYRSMTVATTTEHDHQEIAINLDVGDSHIKLDAWYSLEGSRSTKFDMQVKQGNITRTSSYTTLDEAMTALQERVAEIQNPVVEPTKTELDKAVVQLQALVNDFNGRNPNTPVHFEQTVRSNDTIATVEASVTVPTLINGSYEEHRLSVWADYRLDPNNAQFNGSLMRGVAFQHKDSNGNNKTYLHETTLDVAFKALADKVAELEPKRFKSPEEIEATRQSELEAEAQATAEAQAIAEAQRDGATIATDAEKINAFVEKYRDINPNVVVKVDEKAYDGNDSQLDNFYVKRLSVDFESETQKQQVTLSFSYNHLKMRDSDMTLRSKVMGEVGERHLSFHNDIDAALENFAEQVAVAQKDLVVGEIPVVGGRDEAKIGAGFKEYLQYNHINLLDRQDPSKVAMGYVVAYLENGEETFKNYVEVTLNENNDYVLQVIDNDIEQGNSVGDAFQSPVLDSVVLNKATTDLATAEQVHKALQDINFGQGHIRLDPVREFDIDATPVQSLVDVQATEIARERIAVGLGIEDDYPDVSFTDKEIDLVTYEATIAQVREQDPSSDITLLDYNATNTSGIDVNRTVLMEAVEANSKTNTVRLVADYLPDGKRHSDYQVLITDSKRELSESYNYQHLADAVARYSETTASLKVARQAEINATQDNPVITPTPDNQTTLEREQAQIATFLNDYREQNANSNIEVTVLNDPDTLNVHGQTVQDSVVVNGQTYFISASTTYDDNGTGERSSQWNVRLTNVDTHEIISDANFDNLDDALTDFTAKSQDIANIVERTTQLDIDHQAIVAFGERYHERNPDRTFTIRNSYSDNEKIAEIYVSELINDKTLSMAATYDDNGVRTNDWNFRVLDANKLPIFKQDYASLNAAMKAYIDATYKLHQERPEPLVEPIANFDERMINTFIDEYRVQNADSNIHLDVSRGDNGNISALKIKEALVVNDKSYDVYASANYSNGGQRLNNWQVLVFDNQEGVAISNKHYPLLADALEGYQAQVTDIGTVIEQSQVAKAEYEAVRNFSEKLQEKNPDADINFGSKEARFRGQSFISSVRLAYAVELDGTQRNLVASALFEPDGSREKSWQIRLEGNDTFTLQGLYSNVDEMLVDFEREFTDLKTQKAIEAEATNTLEGEAEVILPNDAPTEVISTLGNRKSDEYYKKVADRLLEQIRNNNAEWQKPFAEGKGSVWQPVNKDGKPYKGLNAINLSMIAMANGYKDNRWFTFNNAKEVGANVRKGEKSSQIFFWKFPDVDKKDPNYDPDDPKNRPIFKVYNVFNADQLDNVPEKGVDFDPVILSDFERNERCEALLEAYVEGTGVKYEHSDIAQGGFRAFYRPSTDTITMPPKEVFVSESAYYVTAFHEAGHSTGHATRLGRDLSGSFGSYSYAKEELRAEIASMFLGQELQIGHDPSDHLAYLKSWEVLLQNDPKEFFKCVKDADKIVNYVMEFEPAREATKDVDATAEQTQTVDKPVEITPEPNTPVVEPAAPVVEPEQPQGQVADTVFKITFTNTDKDTDEFTFTTAEQLEEFLVQDTVYQHDSLYVDNVHVATAERYHEDIYLAQVRAIVADPSLVKDPDVQPIVAENVQETTQDPEVHTPPTPSFDEAYTQYVNNVQGKVAESLQKAGYDDAVVQNYTERTITEANLTKNFKQFDEKMGYLISDSIKKDDSLGFVAGGEAILTDQPQQRAENIEKYKAFVSEYALAIDNDKFYDVQYNADQPSQKTKGEPSPELPDNPVRLRNQEIGKPSFTMSIDSPVSQAMIDTQAKIDALQKPVAPPIPESLGEDTTSDKGDNFSKVFYSETVMLLDDKDRMYSQNYRHIHDLENGSFEYGQSDNNWARKVNIEPYSPLKAMEYGLVAQTDEYRSYQQAFNDYQADVQAYDDTIASYKAQIAEQLKDHIADNGGAKFEMNLMAMNGNRASLDKVEAIAALMQSKGYETSIEQPSEVPYQIEGRSSFDYDYDKKPENVFKLSFEKVGENGEKTPTDIHALVHKDNGNTLVYHDLNPVMLGYQDHVFKDSPNNTLTVSSGLKQRSGEKLATVADDFDRAINTQNHQDLFFGSDELKQAKEVLNNALVKAGYSPETIEKLNGIPDLTATSFATSDSEHSKLENLTFTVGSTAAQRIFSSDEAYHKDAQNMEKYVVFIKDFGQAINNDYFIERNMPIDHHFERLGLDPNQYKGKDDVILQGLPNTKENKDMAVNKPYTPYFEQEFTATTEISEQARENLSKLNASRFVNLGKQSRDNIHSMGEGERMAFEQQKLETVNTIGAKAVSGVPLGENDVKEFRKAIGGLNEVKQIYLEQQASLEQTAPDVAPQAQPEVAPRPPVIEQPQVSQTQPQVAPQAPAAPNQPREPRIVTDEAVKLYVPFEQKDDAKTLGAKWNNNDKHWYAPIGTDLNKFEQWRVPQQKAVSAVKPKIQFSHHKAIDDFTRFLASHGVEVTAGHPKGDGKFYRLSGASDKSYQKNACYVFHLDEGVPRGTYFNHKDGVNVQWEADPSQEKGYTTSTVTQEEINARKAQYEAQRIEGQNKAAEIAQAIVSVADPIPANGHAYLNRKGITGEGLFVMPSNEKLPDNVRDSVVIADNWIQAKEIREAHKQLVEQAYLDKVEAPKLPVVMTKGDLIIPIQNKDGDIRSVQTVSPNGFKSYLKDAEKTNNFTVIGNIENGKPFMVAEGYATGRSLYETNNIPVVVAFDKGNLDSVTTTMREQHPDSRIYIAADNDHETEKKYKEEGRTGANGELNGGIEKAEQAASKHENVYVLIPKFNDDDKGCSDWNDLIMKKGIVEAKTQLRDQVVAINNQVTAEKMAQAQLEKAQQPQKTVEQIIQQSQIVQPQSSPSQSTPTVPPVSQAAPKVSKSDLDR